jgi:hypothetical protein
VLRNQLLQPWPILGFIRLHDVFDQPIQVINFVRGFFQRRLLPLIMLRLEDAICLKFTTLEAGRMSLALARELSTSIHAFPSAPPARTSGGHSYFGSSPLAGFTSSRSMCGRDFVP